MHFNAGGRNGEVFRMDHLAGALDGLAAFTYWAYLEFTGSASSDEDTIGLQWNGLQGAVDNNARRVLIRYDSTSDAVGFFTFTSASVGGSFLGTAIGDGGPHLVCCRYDGSAMNVFVDRHKSATSLSQSGALSSLSTSKVPEILGGHSVTSTGGTPASDSPRMRLYSWGLHDTALTDSEIERLALDPFVLFRPARRVLSAGGTSQVSADIAAGALALTGQSPQPAAGQAIGLGPGALTITGAAFAVQVGNAVPVAIALVPGSLPLTPASFATEVGLSIDAGAGAVALTGQALSGQAGHSVDAGAGSVDLAGQTLTAQAGVVELLGPASLSISGQALSVASGASVSLDIGAGTLIISGAGLSALAGAEAAIAAGTLRLSGQVLVFDDGEAIQVHSARLVTIHGSVRLVAINNLDRIMKVLN